MKELENKIAAYLLGQLTEEEKNQVEASIADDKDAQQLHDELRTILDVSYKHRPIEEVPEQVSGAFYEELGQQGRRSFAGILSGLRLPYLAACVVFFIVGYSVRLSSTSHEIDRGELDELQKEVQNLKATLIDTKLSHASSYERFNAVELLNAESSAQHATLITILNSDPNVNVRVAAANAMLIHYDSFENWSGIIKDSFSKQSDPILKVTLIHMMMIKDQQEGIKLINEYLNDEDLPDPVKAQLTKTLEAT